MKFFKIVVSTTKNVFKCFIQCYRKTTKIAVLRYFVTVVGSFVQSSKCQKRVIFGHSRHRLSFLVIQSIGCFYQFVIMFYEHVCKFSFYVLILEVTQFQIHTHSCIYSYIKCTPRSILISYHEFKIFAFTQYVLLKRKAKCYFIDCIHSVQKCLQVPFFMH